MPGLKSWNEFKQPFFFILTRKRSVRNSSVLQSVCIKKSVICSSRYEDTDLIILRANFGCKDSLLNYAYKELFSYEIYSDLRKIIILPAKQEPFLLLTRWANVHHNY